MVGFVIDLESIKDILDSHKHVLYLGCTEDTQCGTYSFVDPIGGFVCETQDETSIMKTLTNDIISEIHRWKKDEYGYIRIIRFMVRADNEAVREKIADVVSHGRPSPLNLLLKVGYKKMLVTEVKQVPPGRRWKIMYE